MKADPHPSPPRRPVAERLFATVFGLFLGLCLLKFGNPPIMEKYVTAPSEFYEFLLGYPWPIEWAYRLLIVIGFLAVFSWRWKPTPPQWLTALPLFWLAWQFLSGIQSVDSRLTIPTLKHFGACVACFYLGLFCLGRIKNLVPFWMGIIGGLLLVLVVGFDQRFGGLKEARDYFYLYVYPTLTEPPPPEYLKKLSSTRIFSTLFYPNALAGALLLVLPPIMALILTTKRMTWPARVVLATLLGLAAAACLFWSGSKGGWLLMLLVGLIALLRLPFKMEYKVVLVSCVLVAGLTGFFWKYSGFFQRGATSVSARFDYWRAAVRTIKEKPSFGTGPGTFAIPYARIKRPESEMARLVHNDYLEQGSDSGIPGLIFYSVFIAGALIWTFRTRVAVRSKPAVPQQLEEQESPQNLVQDWGAFSIWLGVLGWSLQGLMEFGLYIPGLAWLAFALFGWLLGSAPGSDTAAKSHRQNQPTVAKSAGAR